MKYFSVLLFILCSDLSKSQNKDTVIQGEKCNFYERTTGKVLAGNYDENKKAQGWFFTFYQLYSPGNYYLSKKEFFRNDTLLKSRTYLPGKILADSLDYSVTTGKVYYKFDGNGRVFLSEKEKAGNGKSNLIIHFHYEVNRKIITQISWEEKAKGIFIEKKYNWNGVITEYGIYDLRDQSFIEIRTYSAGKISRIGKKLPNGWEYQDFWTDGKLMAYQLLDEESNTIAFKGYYSNGTLHWKFLFSEKGNYIFMYDRKGILEYKIPYSGKYTEEKFYFKRDESGEMRMYKGDIRIKEFNRTQEQILYGSSMFYVVYEIGEIQQAPYLFW